MPPGRLAATTLSAGWSATNGSGSTISNAYATGQVSGSTTVGGLVGYQESAASTTPTPPGRSAAAATVGGLVGFQADGSISNAYATGRSAARRACRRAGRPANRAAASATPMPPGRLAARATRRRAGRLPSSGSISSSYWNTQTAGQTIQGVGGGLQDGVTGKTTAGLTNPSALGWDSTIWGTETLAESAQAAGYRNAGDSLVFLKGLTRDQDKISTNGTLFNGGYGTAAAAWTLTSWQQLQNINHNSTTLGGHYQLETNLDKNSAGYAESTPAPQPTAEPGLEADWDNSSGATATRFTGNFDGQNHTISDLTIDRPASKSSGSVWHDPGCHAAQYGVGGCEY